VEVIVKDDPDSVSDEAAAIVAEMVQSHPGPVLGLATGSTPLGLYQRLVRLHRETGLSFARVTTFNLDEYLGLSPEHPQSYHYFMWANLFSHLDIDPGRVHILDGMAADPVAECARYEAAIRAAGGIDLQILGIGRDGHIGFNEPGSSLSSRTRIKTLTPETIADNARFFGSPERVPRMALTMGVGTILESRLCLLLATGENKAEALAAAVEGPVTAQVTASALQFHQRAIVIADRAAASRLRRIEYYRWAYENKAMI